MGRLVQLGCRLGDRVLWPDQVHDLLAVQAPARHQGEHLDERRRVAAFPAGLGDRDAADRHGEPAEQRDGDLAGLTRAGRHARGPAFLRAVCVR
jgi:hypothetical protein